MKIHYLETGSTNPFYNLAFEEYVLLNRREGDCLLLWQNRNTIVVGQNQNTDEEINHSFVETHQIRVVRRSTGGGAVYHDLGNLNYSFITDKGDPEKMSVGRFMAPVVEALKGLGLHAEASGRNDILIDGKKVSGTAQRMTRNRILHHGTLLFDSNPEMVEGALRVDPEKYRSKGIKSVRSRVGNIRDFLKEDMTLPEFWKYLKGALLAQDFSADQLSPDELAAVTALKESKYDTWEWNYGHSPAYNFRNRKRFEGGSLEALVFVKDGIIEEAAFYGDFLSLRPVKEVSDGLAGCRFASPDIRNVLGKYSLDEYFGSLSQDDILSVFFDA